MSNNSTTVTAKPNKLSKRRRREGLCDDETKPLVCNLNDTVLETQCAQKDPIHLDDKQPEPATKRKRNRHHDDQASDEREEKEVSRPKLDTKGFEFDFKQGEEMGGETGEVANTTKQAKKKKKGKKNTEGSVGTLPDVKPVLGQKEALEYLRSWHADKDSWSFKKKAQYWLLQNIYKKELISKSDFKVLLLYLESMQGNQRQLTIERAQQVLDGYEKGPEDSSSPGLGLSKTAYKRAVEVLRVLS